MPLNSIKALTALLVVVLILPVISACSAHRPATPPEQPQRKENVFPENSFYYFTASQISRKSGDIDRAIEYLKKAMEFDPSSMMLKRELVQLYWQNKDDRAAVALIEELVKEQPLDVENLILLARIKHSTKKLDEAKSAYEKILSLDPRQKNIYLILGGLYTDEGNTEFALQIYEKLVRQFPDFFAGYYLLGQMNALTGRTSEAEKNLLKALDMEPGLDEARYELVDLYKRQGKKKYQNKIFRLYEQILTDNPGDIRAAAELGLFYHEAGYPGDAERKLKDLGRKIPDDQQILSFVIQRYIDRREFESALVVLTYLQKGAPKNSEIDYLLGMTYHGMGDRNMAIRHLKNIHPLSRFYNNAVGYVVYLYQEDEKIDQATAYLKDVIKAQPGNPEFYLYLAGLYEEAEVFEDAEAVLRQGLSNVTEKNKLYFRLGIVYDKWGKKEDSIEMMRTVIRLDPKDANALNYLGYTYADLGKNLDEAERLVQEALKHKPEDGYIIDSLGWVYYKKGNYEKALEILEKAVSLVPDDPTILEHLGDAYIKLNDKKKALDIYKKSLLNAQNGKEGLRKKIREICEEGN